VPEENPAERGRGMGTTDIRLLGGWRYRKEYRIPTSTIIRKRCFESPDEMRLFNKGRLDVVKFDAVTVARAMFKPGWKWSQGGKLVEETDRCQVPHLGYMVAGRMQFVMDDGCAAEIETGDLAMIPPGHEAWVIGDEPAIFLDVAGVSRTIE
jgi:hypothetical protein